MSRTARPKSEFLPIAASEDLDVLDYCIASHPRSVDNISQAVAKDSTDSLASFGCLIIYIGQQH